MDSPQSDCLFDDIACFLRDDSCVQSAQAFWTERASITAREVSMLQALTRGPQCAETLARLLDSDCARTQQLLDALLSVGILERCGTQYANTPAATLYCRLYLQSPTP